MSVRSTQIRETFNELIKTCFISGLKIVNRFVETPVTEYKVDVQFSTKALDAKIEDGFSNCIYMNFEGGISGMILFMFPHEKETSIAHSFVKGYAKGRIDVLKDNKQEHELLKEVSNIVFCNILGTFSNLTLHYTNYLPPIFGKAESVSQLVRNFINYTCVEIEFELNDSEAKTSIFIVFKHPRSFERFIEPYIDNYSNNNNSY